jgi:hypothetical protein
MQVQNTFVWRAITGKDFEETLPSFDVPEDTVRAAFEVIEKDGKVKMRRKPVAATIELPDFVTNLPDLAKDVITTYVAGFVKARFLDAFQPIGDHSWSAIEAWAAERGQSGRRAEFDISKEQLEEAALSIGRYMAAALRNEAAGEKFKAAVIGRYSRSAILRNLGLFNEDTIKKLQKRLEDWLAFVAENEAEAADDMAAVYDMLASKLAGHLNQNSKAVAELL